MNNQKEQVRNYIIDRLNDGIGAGCAEDLHHHLVNEDYFIIGYIEAAKFCGEETFKIVEKIREYEQSNFGEVNTDFSDPEKVANMFAYIVGEEILGESEILREKWDEDLTEEDLEEIAEELDKIVWQSKI